MHSSSSRNTCSHIHTGDIKYTVDRTICITSGGTLGFRGTTVENHCSRERATLVEKHFNFQAFLVLCG